MASMVLIGEEELDEYEFLLLDIIDDGDDVRRKDVRMVEKESSRKRELRILNECGEGFGGGSGRVLSKMSR